MYLIDFGERLGRTMTSFKQRFFESDYMGYNWTLKEGCANKIHALIADKCLSMSGADYLTLPARIDQIVKVRLPDKVLKAYKSFESDLLLEL